MYSASFADLINSKCIKMEMHQHRRHNRYKRQHTQKRTESDLTTQIFKFSVAIFQIMVACQSITSITAQGSMYDDSKLHSQSTGILEADSILSTQSETLDHRGTDSSASSKLIRFEPTFLNFETEPVGMPKMQIVYIHNPSRDKELNLISISANTANFHSSFFDDKIVPPLGNTSFEVVFLARVVGKEECTLFIHAIQGTFKFQVEGTGIPNPYRLRPYIGAKVPVNTSFSPLINMHNPTNQTLQVTEMYSSSGYLQLQLPNNERTTDKEFWEIPPYETKCLMRARFLGQVAANHTAYIRIKTNQTDFPELHILPVEVEVSSAPGIYSSTELLDFGTLRSHDEPKTLSLFLLNSGRKDVIIQNVTSTQRNPAITIQFRPVKLKPSESVFTKIANITFNSYKVLSAKHKSGYIVINTKDRKYPAVKIPYCVEILEGTLGYDHYATLFMKNTRISSEQIVRDIPLTSTFKFPVVLQAINLPEEAKPFFKIVNFTGPTLLPANSEITPFSVYFDPTGKIATSKLRNIRKKKRTVPTESESATSGTFYYVVLHSNASKFSLPLYTYSGDLTYKVLREETEKLDFGIMGVSDSRQILFALYNYNPINVNVTAVNASLSAISLKMVSLTQGSSNLTVFDEISNFELPSNSCAVFEVTLNTSNNEQEILSAVKIFTNFQVLQVPILAQVVIGALVVKPAKAKLPPSFPGLIVQQSITVTNTFAQMTKLESVTPRYEDKRFYFKKIKNKVLDLESNKKVKVGKIYFDARQSCKPDRCYVGLPTSTTTGHHWLTTLTLSQEAVELDQKLYKLLKDRWQNVIDNQVKKPNTSMVLATNVALSVDIPVQAELIWPTLLEEETFQFPLTHIGRKSVAVLTLNNPADSPVIVQVLPLSYYPQPKAILDMLGWKKMKNSLSLVTKNHSVFNIVSPLNEKDTSMVWLEYTLNGKLNRSAVNLFLHPNQRVTLKVEFMPYDDKPKSTIIVLRNNLTVVDALVVRGTGALEHMKLGGKIPNSPNNVLRIKLTESILKDCKDRNKSAPNFTVRKSFTAKNMGLLPIQVSNIMINNSPCEGYGFRVLDCEQFILQPNATKDILIAYTPDFMSYQITHKLRIMTAQSNEMAFTLNVTVPAHMLPVCQNAIPRPSWESTLSAFISVVMVGLFGAVILNAYLEAMNLWEPFVKMYEDSLKNSNKNVKAPPGFGKKFDLREITVNYISTVASSPANDIKINNDGMPFKNGEPTMTSVKENEHCLYKLCFNMNFWQQKFTSFGTLFAKTKRRRPFKKPIELKDTSLLDHGNLSDHIKPVKTSKPENTTHPNHNTKYVTVKEQNIAAKAKTNSNGHQPLSSVSNLRKRNTTLVSTDTKKNYNKAKSQDSKSDLAFENSSAVPDCIPPFDPVLIAKTSAQQRGRNFKRSSTSSSGSADYSSNDYAVGKNKENLRKKSKAKVKTERFDKAKFSMLNSKDRDDCSSTTTERSNEDFEQFHDTKHTPVSDDEHKVVSVRRETGKNLSRNRRRASSNQQEQKEASYFSYNRTLEKPHKDFNPYFRMSKQHQYRNKMNSDSVVSYNAQISPSKSSSGSCSSTEDSSIWETPNRSNFGQDHDEGMKVLSEQSFKAAENILKQNKSDFDPLNTSKEKLSRHSSYSSIVSSSSSSDSNPGKKKSNVTPVELTNSKEKKSNSRQKNQPRNNYTKNKSKSQETFYLAPTSHNSPVNQVSSQPLFNNSMFSNLNPPQKNQPRQRNASPNKVKVNNGKELEQSYQWNSPTSSYSAFGRSSFSIAESIVSPYEMQSGPGVDWSTPFTESTSLYSTPISENKSGQSAYQIAPRSSKTIKDNWPQPQTSFSAFSDYRTQTSQSDEQWKEPTYTETSNVMSTHSIWSVSNAVTMDEDRTADESIPVGLKSIWSNDIDKRSLDRFRKPSFKDI